MAESIIDVIARLSLDVTSKGLDAQIQALQKQASLIDAQQKKLDNLKIAYDNAANPQAQQALQAQITKTSAVIDANTASLQKNFAANKQIQKAIEDEVGIINQLSRTLAGLQEGQKKATSPADIKAFSENIRVVQSEMKALLTPNEPIRQTGAIEALQLKITQLGNAIKQAPAKDVAALNQELAKTQKQLTVISSQGKEEEKKGGVLASIFGGQSLGRQLLQGSLLGLGIGSGFGIITRAVSGLIEELEKTDIGISFAKGIDRVGDSMRGTTKYADELKAAINSTKTTIEGLLSDFEKLTINTPGSAGNVSALQGNEAIAKSFGVISGLSGEADKRNFQAALSTEAKQLKDLNDITELRKKLLGDITKTNDELITETKKYNDAVNASGADRSGFLAAATQDAFSKKTTDIIKQQFSPDAETIAGQNLSPEKLKEYSVLYQNALNKIQEQARLTASDLQTIIAPLLASLDVGVKTASDAYETQLAKITALQNEYNAKIETANFELNKTLRRQNKDAADKNSETAITDQESLGQKTISSIHNRINLERDLELRQNEQAKQDEADKLTVTGKISDLRLDIQQAYAIKAFNINHKFNIQTAKETLDFYYQQLDAQQAYLEQINKLELDANGKRLDEAKKDTADTLGLNIHQFVLEANARLLANSKAYDDAQKQKDNEIKGLERQEKDAQIGLDKIRDTGSEKQIRDAQKNLDAAIEQIRVAKSEESDLYQHYAELEIQIEKKKNDALLDGNKKTNDEIIARDAKALEQQIDAIKAKGKTFFGQQGDIQKAQLASAFNDVDQADNNLFVVKNAGGDEAQIKEAEDGLNKAQIHLKEVQLQIRNVILDSIIEITQSINTSIQLVGTAINQMYDRQEKLLDTQLQAQQIRVNNATELAKRGDTEQLRSEQDKLNGIAKARENLTRRQVQLNNILAVSNAAVAASEAIVAVIKAAGNTTEGGVVSFIVALVAGAAAVAALVISIKSAAQANQFDEGGYTGDGGKKDVAGTVHKGEFVMNKATTAKHRGLFEAIHSNQPIPIHELAHLRMAPLQTLNPQPFASKAEINSLSKKLDGVIDAINANTVNVKQNVDKNGVMQMVETQKKIERRRFMS